jgi:DNA repair exonuclease SbcCD ATPase subunit
MNCKFPSCNRLLTLETFVEHTKACDSSPNSDKPDPTSRLYREHQENYEKHTLKRNKFESDIADIKLVIKQREDSIHTMREDRVKSQEHLIKAKEAAIKAKEEEEEEEEKDTNEQLAKYRDHMNEIIKEKRDLLQAKLDLSLLLKQLIRENDQLQRVTTTLSEIQTSLVKTLRSMIELRNLQIKRA